MTFLLAIAAANFKVGHASGTGAAVAFGIVILALGISIWYSPDYLHLTVDSEKKARWEIKIRWRLIPAALLIGVVFAPGARDVPVILAAAAWLTAANLLARAVVPPVYYPAYFWGTDFILVAALLRSARCDVLLGAALLAAAAHLLIVVCPGHPFSWAVGIFSSALVLIFLAGFGRGASLSAFLLSASLLFVSALGTAWLVRRAQRHNAENTGAAMRSPSFSEIPAACQFLASS